MKIILNLIFTLIIGLLNSQTNKIHGLEWIGKTPKTTNKRLILCEFWATWCHPCIKAMPHIEYLSEHNKSNLTTIYISDESSYTINKWMKKHNKSFFSISDPKRKNFHFYKINALPKSIIFGSNGEVIWKGSPSQISQDLINKLLEKSSKKINNIPIDLYTLKKETYSYKTYKIQNQNIYYRTIKPIESRLNIDSLSFNFSGNLKELISYSYNIPSNQIKISDELNSYLEIKINKKNSYANLLSTFIEKKLGLNIIEENEEVNAVKIIKQKNTIGLNSSTYDFSENKTTFTIDDENIWMDNLTGNQMVQTLNLFSSNYFIAEGFDSTIYDWKIHYKFDILTKDQIINELNCKLKEMKVNIKKLKVSKQ